MTEMESPLENYADGLGFHFDGYFIWRLLYRRVEDALSQNAVSTQALQLDLLNFLLLYLYISRTNNNFSKFNNASIMKNILIKIINLFFTSNLFYHICTYNSHPWSLSPFSLVVFFFFQDRGEFFVILGLKSSIYIFFLPISFSIIWLFHINLVFFLFFCYLIIVLVCV